MLFLNHLFSPFFLSIFFCVSGTEELGEKRFGVDYCQFGSSRCKTCGIVIAKKCCCLLLIKTLFTVKMCVDKKPELNRLSKMIYLNFFFFDFVYVIYIRIS